jgi:hypothetical protein
MLRIKHIEPVGDFRVRLELTDGSIIEREVGPLLRGPVFEAIRSDVREFAKVRVEEGALVWPNGADLCPDMVIWNGLPPDDDKSAPEPQLPLNSER